MSELSGQSHRNSKLVLINSILKDFGCISHEDTESLVTYGDKLKRAVCNMRMTQVDGIPSIIDMIDYLYIGSIGSAYNLTELKRAGITHILCLSAEIQLKYPNDFIYKRVDLMDKPNFDITSSFSSCYEFILNAKSQGGRCLIHCYQGKSRCLSIVFDVFLFDTSMMKVSIRIQPILIDMFHFINCVGVLLSHVHIWYIIIIVALGLLWKVYERIGL